MRGAEVAKKSADLPAETWTNSLGMKFVPVPGTSVLFSIWVTRVQDYQAFVTATGRAWKKPNFEQGPTHPAVRVSWDDAKAFCAWLTEKERSSGTLTATQEYRLPTDLEWSTAVGLEKETGSIRREHHMDIAGVYPWGTQWPPPRGVGNYSAKLQVDDFDKTSPVGSFPANRFGLYDMGGNVWQSCEDFCAGQNSNHVKRGGSWRAYGLDNMLSSHCGRGIGREDIHGVIGFRVVLASSGVLAPQPPASRASAAASPEEKPATPAERIKEIKRLLQRREIKQEEHDRRVKEILDAI